GLWLNHKGRVIADSFVHRVGPEAFWVGSYFCEAAVIRERLEAFVIADDVSIEDVTDQWQGVTLLGEHSEERLAGIGDGLFSFVGRRTNAPHREYVFPPTLEAAMFSRLQGIRQIDAEEMNRLRIEQGIVAVPADIGLGELPNEGGLEVGISFVKGCYLGQEVMARLKNLGQVRRRVMRVKGEGALPQLPADIFQGDRRIGEIRTAARTAEGFVALALISLLHLQRESRMSLAPGGPAVLTLVEPA
ncbi:MAG TPA: folate-binding protein, partial [Opitutus sp.]|nr:folate-binding protein [Opitutus sp.]